METNNLIMSLSYEKLELRHKRRKFKGDAIVFTDCGGDILEWVNGIPQLMIDTGVIKPGSKYTTNDFYKLATVDGHVDLIFDYFPKDIVNPSKICTWCVSMGNCESLFGYLSKRLSKPQINFSNGENNDTSESYEGLEGQLSIQQSQQTSHKAQKRRKISVHMHQKK